jgi:hypothetical protein
MVAMVVMVMVVVLLLLLARILLVHCHTMYWCCSIGLRHYCCSVSLCPKLARAPHGHRPPQYYVTRHYASANRFTSTHLLSSALFPTTFCFILLLLFKIAVAFLNYLLSPFFFCSLKSPSHS